VGRLTDLGRDGTRRGRAVAVQVPWRLHEMFLNATLWKRGTHGRDAAGT